jgi:hypothetical protein
MDKLEQAAFVQAYGYHVCNAPQKVVEAFVADYENGDDVSEYSEHYTSIMDALGMWHAGVHFQLSKSLRELK